MFRRLARLAVFSLLLQGVPAWSQPTVEFPFRLRGGLIWIQIETSPTAKRLNFVLDSGAEVSVIDVQASHRLKLEPGKAVIVRGIGGTTRGDWPEHLSANVGGVPLSSEYLCMDLSAVGAACDCRADGLIGADFFSGRIVQIDFSKQKIRLIETIIPDHGAETLPMQVQSARMRVPIEVDGLGTNWARLDTGCASALHWAVCSVPPANELVSEELGVGVSSQTIRQSRKTAHLGRITFRDLATGLHTEKLLDGEAGLLGCGLLARFSVVTIDARSGHLILEGVARPPIPLGRR